jgi:predicted NBD/HSP70 family sugar kinase
MSKVDLLSDVGEKHVLQSLLLRGPATKAELSRRLGVNQMKVGRIVDKMIHQGVIQEWGEKVTGRGRPGTLLNLATGSSPVAGFKIRDSKIIGALTNLQATVLAKTEKDIQAKSPEQLIAQIRSALIEMANEADIDYERVLGVGLGISGLVDAELGILQESPFLHWKNIRIRDELSKALGTAVFIENDVNTLGLAELWFGNASAAKDSLVVTIGQGIGLCVMRDGKLLNIPAEFGHTQVSANGRLCNCGNVGCLEALAGEQALIDSVKQLRPGLKINSAEQVYALAKTDPKVHLILERAASEIGHGLANLINLFKPRTVFLAGEGLLAGPTFTAQIQASALERTHPLLRGTFNLVIDDLPEVAWARGAASLVLHALFGSRAVEDFKKITT